MHYDRVILGTFIDRPNRFIAICEITDPDTGQKAVSRCHVKNTGRCREILVPGARVVLSVSDNPDRKTAFDLIAAYKNGILINIDSQAPNKAFQEFIPRSGLFGKEPIIHPEYTHGDSRFDFFIEDGDRRCLVEVKGVTLEFDGECRFPDAPTERGLKHLRGLRDALSEGYESYAAFVVQMKPMRCFTPNYSTHEEFGEVLEEVHRDGVGILVYDCAVTPDSMAVDSPLPFKFR
jgi:sugar fermentation stimulation protein A